MAYRVAQLPMTLNEAEGHFCFLNLCNIHNSGNMACLLKVESARVLQR